MKKVILIITYISLCIMFAMPVTAAEVVSKEGVVEIKDVNTSLFSTSSFSKTLSKINSINGIASPVMTFRSGSIIGSDAQITSVRLYVRTSAGSAPFIVYIQSPDGTIYSFVVTSSKTLELDFLMERIQLVIGQYGLKH